MRGTLGSPRTAMSLSDIQRHVASVVLSLPEATEGTLAGGAALIFHEVTNRATRDLNCSAHPSSPLIDWCRSPQLVSKTPVSRWTSNRSILASPVFEFRLVPQRRCSISGFHPAGLPPTLTELGAVRALPDLAGDKLLALFSRAAPRDFVDVVGLLGWFSREEMIALAATKDRGLNAHVLGDTFGVLPTIRRDRFDLDDSSYESMCSLLPRVGETSSTANRARPHGS